MTITPKDVYSSYPSSDLIPLDPPKDDETFDAYIARVGRNNIRRCGDTLYAFLMFELAEDCSTKELANRALDLAIKDIEAVQDHINSKDTE